MENPHECYERMNKMRTLLYKWPEDEVEIAEKYWRPKRLAHEWGCSYRTAYRWMQNNTDFVIALTLKMPDGKAQIIKVVKAGQKRFQKSNRGNPKFYSSAFQMEMANRRAKKRAKEKSRFESKEGGTP